MNLLLLDHTHILVSKADFQLIVKFILLSSCSEKTFAKINLFCFLVPYIAIGKKGAMLVNTENQNQPFLAEIKKRIISFQRLSILSKYHMQRLSLQIIFSTKGLLSIQLKQL